VAQNELHRPAAEATRSVVEQYRTARIRALHATFAGSGGQLLPVVHRVEHLEARVIHQ
jgi:hypothetical protein